MIEVNKEMTWEEAYKTYPHRKAMVKVLKYEDDDRYKTPLRMFVYKIVENLDDLEIVDEEIDRGGYVCDTVVFPYEDGDFFSNYAHIGGVEFK